MIRDLTADIPKRELFSRLAGHLNLLGSIVEREIATGDTPPVSAP
ncbi:hypothetical protein [Bradyrhizobium sp. 41S5]|nr:hypothetical protein [Bradyrhizobium sp. 41S5]